MYWNILTMHGPIKVKSPNIISEWQMGFNSAFKGLILDYRFGISNRNRTEPFGSIEDTLLLQTLLHFWFVGMHKLYV
jgi:hypothetical protein